MSNLTEKRNLTLDKSIVLWKEIHKRVSDEEYGHDRKLARLKQRVYDDLGLDYDIADCPLCTFSVETTPDVLYEESCENCPLYLKWGKKVTDNVKTCMDDGSIYDDVKNEIKDLDLLNYSPSLAIVERLEYIKSLGGDYFGDEK